MRQLNQVIAGERHRLAFRVMRRVGVLTHDARAWVNEQLTLARNGLRQGDAEGLSLAHARRFPRLASTSAPSIGDARTGVS